MFPEWKQHTDKHLLYVYAVIPGSYKLTVSSVTWLFIDNHHLSKNQMHGQQLRFKSMVRNNHASFCKYKLTNLKIVEKLNTGWRPSILHRCYPSRRRRLTLQRYVSDDIHTIKRSCVHFDMSRYRCRWGWCNRTCRRGSCYEYLMKWLIQAG